MSQKVLAIRMGMTEKYVSTIVNEVKSILKPMTMEGHHVNLGIPSN